jgi:hypothetical protein
MVLLEKLDSKQRAVFILKEAFDYDHQEIAKVLDITEENSRKILSRAKSELKIESLHPRPRNPDIFSKYLSAIKNAEINELEKLLKNEIKVVSDGGGKATAFRNVISGIKSVSALLMGLYRKSYRHARIDLSSVNGEPALFYFVEDQLVTCQILSIVDDKIDGVFFIRNPDKLKNLKKV